MLDLEEIDNFPSRLLTEPAKSVAPINPHDPARLGYPATLPIEIAMRTSSTRAVCEAYGIAEEEWEQIRHDPTFLADLQRAVDMLKEEGMSFKVKARLQSEEILKSSWRLIHDPSTPPAVRADMMKATVRWAGYDSPATTQAAAGAGFSISINFNGNPNEPKIVNP